VSASTVTNASDVYLEEEFRTFLESEIDILWIVIFTASEEAAAWQRAEIRTNTRLSLSELRHSKVELVNLPDDCRLEICGETDYPSIRTFLKRDKLKAWRFPKSGVFALIVNANFSQILPVPQFRKCVFAAER
jgi:hypothetical protein